MGQSIRWIRTELWIVFFLLFGLTAHLHGQQQSIQGTVNDASTLETLPGVNVVVKGTTTGTSTDAEGGFGLTVPSLSDTLVFSFVGYQTQEVPIGGRTEIDVRLQSQAIAGEEMVVVGYGIRERETLTGSVSAVSGKNLEKVPTTNVSNALGGRLPGVITVNDSGEPGFDGSTIRIRGNQTLNNNSPLVVIDGVPDRSGGFNRLNPKDIESISVLKDASAAIYGSRAANGVILVTTKRGNIGQAPEFTLNFNQGLNQPTRIPEMADASTYMKMLNEIDIYSGSSPRYSEEEIQKYSDPDSDPWLYPNTDWFDAALKPVSLQTRADVAVSGGSENIAYHLSLGGLTEDGYYEHSATRYNQYDFRSNIDAHISENIDLRFDVNGRLEDRNFSTVPAGQNFRMLIRGKPNLPAYWPNGQPGPDIESGVNPVVTGSDESGYINNERYYFQSNLELNVQIPGVDGLSLRGRMSYDHDLQARKEWNKPWTLYTFDRAGYMNNGGDPTQYLEGGPRGPENPTLDQRTENNRDMLLRLVAEYQQDFSDHSVNILAGSERQTFSNSFFTAYRQGYISSQIDQLFAGSEAGLSNDGNANDGAILNVFTRLNYDYQDKYLLEFIGRYDGSYIFPEGKQFGFFPSFSAGWRLTEEEFLEDNIGRLFNEFKIRASWGQTGNDRVDPYQYLGTYSFGAGYVFDGSEVNSIYQDRIANENITWELATQFDIGVVGELLDNRLSFELDYYQNLRSDILIFRNASVPQTTGLSLPRENLGEVKSWGYDGSISWRQQVNPDFLFDLTVNGGYAANEIKFWDEAPGAPEWQQSTGHRMDTGLYYKAIGVFEDQEEVNNYPHWSNARPGDVIFEDVNGDGEITADDRVRSDENNMPKWTGGINLSGSYKQFDFTVFFQGAAGAVQYWRTQSGDFGNYFRQYAEKRWRPDPNDPSGMTPHPDYSNEGPRAFDRTVQYWIANNNTYFLRETDYIRLKTVELGYTVSQEFITKLGLKELRAYVNGYNLLTWDKFKLMDPEASNVAGSYYPQKRVFNVGFSLTF